MSVILVFIVLFSSFLFLTFIAMIKGIAVVLPIKFLLYIRENGRGLSEVYPRRSCCLSGPFCRIILTST